MRLVKRQELMTLPAGTLFATCRQPWVFDELELKLDTIVRDGQNQDFWVRTLAWIDADHTGDAIDRLDAMAADSSVSYPLDEVLSRHGPYDDERLYLVYEPADVQSLITALTQSGV